MGLWPLVFNKARSLKLINLGRRRRGEREKRIILLF
jgi:hypothetical protein